MLQLLIFSLLLIHWTENLNGSYPNLACLYLAAWIGKSKFKMIRRRGIYIETRISSSNACIGLNKL